MVNVLEGANPPHFFQKDEEFIFAFSNFFINLLQDIYTDFLEIERGWNFLNNSDWFLETIQNFVEFVSLILEQLKSRSVIPFLEAFGKVGSYAGFAQACVGLFGEDVLIEYIDLTYTINISNISSSIFFNFVGEGRNDFNFLTEDSTSIFRTEDIITPPSGLSTIREILRKFLPAEHSEVVTINFLI